MAIEVAPIAVEYVFTPQSVHDPDPTFALYLPASHLVHSLAPAREYLPAEQS